VADAHARLDADGQPDYELFLCRTGAGCSSSARSASGTASHGDHKVDVQKPADTVGAASTRFDQFDVVPLPVLLCHGPLEFRFPLDHRDLSPLEQDAHALPRALSGWNRILTRSLGEPGGGRGRNDAIRSIYQVPSLSLGTEPPRSRRAIPDFETPPHITPFRRSSTTRRLHEVRERRLIAGHLTSRLAADVRPSPRVADH